MMVGFVTFGVFRCGRLAAGGAGGFGGGGRLEVDDGQASGFNNFHKFWYRLLLYLVYNYGHVLIVSALPCALRGTQPAPHGW